MILNQIAEAVGGYFSNSLAVMTDAAHMLSDFTSFLISLFAIWISSRAPSRKMSFGYYRAGIVAPSFPKYSLLFHIALIYPQKFLVLYLASLL